MKNNRVRKQRIFFRRGQLSDAKSGQHGDCGVRFEQDSRRHGANRRIRLLRADAAWRNRFSRRIEKIGHYAFSCTGLKELKLPRGLQRIGSHAFGNCIELEHVQIPDSVTYIGTNAFVCEQEIGTYYVCTSMTAVITDSLTELKEETFISSCTIYTSHTAMPDGWKNALLVDGFRQAPKSFGGASLRLTTTVCLTLCLRR